jgi:hypothetical protein
MAVTAVSAAPDGILDVTHHFVTFYPSLSLLSIFPSIFL